MAAPQMTRARLERILRARFGTTARGAIDVRAAAEELGVSPSTVYRWLHTSSGRQLARMPRERVAQVENLISVDPETQRIEEQQLHFARKAIERIEAGNPREVWTRQRWTEPHRVAILQLAEPAIRQVTATRVDGTTSRVEWRGRVLSETVVPTRFHATVLIHAVLQQQARWRFRADSAVVSQGYTQSWMLGAPAVHLDALARHLGLSRKRRRPHLPKSRKQRTKGARDA